MPECDVIDGPTNGDITNDATSFVDGDIQTITCGSGFRLNGMANLTCTAIDGDSAEWSPSPDDTMCGKINSYYLTHDLFTDKHNICKLA